MAQQFPTEFKLKHIISTLKSIPRIIKLLFGVHKVFLILITIVSLFSGVIPAITIYSTQLLINAIQTSNNQEFTYILTPLIFYIGLNFAGFIIAQVSSYLQSMFKLQLNYKMNLILLEKAEKFNLKDFEDSETYDRLRRAQNEIGDRPYGIFSILVNLMSQIITLVTSSIILMMWKPWIIIPIIIVPLVSTIFMTKLGYTKYKIEWARAPLRRKSWYYNYLMTNDIAFKEVKLYNLGRYLINSYKKIQEDFIKIDKTIINKRTRLSVIFEVIDQIISGFIIYLIIFSAYLGEILLGNTVAYIRSLSNVKSYTQAILGSISALYENNLYINQLFGFLDYPVEELNDNNKKAIDEIESIQFNNVSFKYPNRSDYALKNISFKIGKGENIALVGENGSGKTTLIKLICCFYDRYEGEILINGLSLREIEKNTIREKIGVIFQDFNKYELTCRENIAFGKLEYLLDDVKISESIKQANANNIIEALPNGINSQLGSWFDYGVQLSGGQWQKIALSRAFLREADCYIFDEPSSALDPISEAEIFIKTNQLIEEKIGIFISHRLFNLRKISSKILVLKDGKLIEEGNHDRLMSIESHYKYLYNLQNHIEADNEERKGEFYDTTA